MLAEIERMRQICDSLAVRAVNDSEAAYSKVQNDIYTTQKKSVRLGREINVLRFICTKSGRKFVKARPGEIVQLMSQEIGHIMDHVDAALCQAICSNLSMVFHKPELLARMLVDYITSPGFSGSVEAVANLTFTTFFCNFSSFEYVANGGSVLLAMMDMPRALPFVEVFMEPYLLSMYPFYETLWYNFKKLMWPVKIEDGHILKVLLQSLEMTTKLIDWGYQELLRHYYEVHQFSDKLLVLVKIVIYKSAKVYFRLSPQMMEAPSTWEAVLKSLKKLTVAPASRGAQLVAVSLTMSDQQISSTPILVDAAKMQCLPMLVTKYDIANYGRTVLPAGQQAMLSDLGQEKNLKASVFNVFSMDYYYNRTYFASEPECEIIETIKFKIDRSFFTNAEWKEYKSIYNSSETKQFRFETMPKNFELFVLYQTATERNESIQRMNQTFELLHVKQDMEEYQRSLERFHFLAVLKFWATYMGDIVTCDKRRPLSSMKMGVSWLIGLPDIAAFFARPFLIQLLNTIPVDLELGVTRAMEASFNKILGSFNEILAKSQAWWKRDDDLLKSRQYGHAIQLIAWSENLKMGNCMELCLEFIETVHSIPDLGRRDKLLEFYASLIVASQNTRLLRVMLFIDRFFRMPGLSILAGSLTLERWTRLMQSLWFIVSNDRDLMNLCDSPCS